MKNMALGTHRTRVRKAGIHGDAVAVDRFSRVRSSIDRSRTEERS